MAMLQDEGVDPQGGIQYSRYDRVRVERVWKENLTKESETRQEAKSQSGPQSYVMNLANLSGVGGGMNLLRLKHSHSRLEIITEKPEKNTPEARMSLEGFDPKGFEVTAMKHKEKTPTKKWDLPCTATQEIGWLISNPASADMLRSRQRAKWNGTSLTRSGEKASLSATAPSSSSTAQGVGIPRSASVPSVPMAAHLPVGAPHRELHQLNTTRWRKPRNTCPITQYADTYVGLMRCNPFDQGAAGR